MLEALRLLLKAEGSHRDRRLAAAVLAPSSCKDFDVVLMDLNYARDTTSGEEGLDCCSGFTPPTNPAGRRHDGLGQRRIAVEAMRRGARDFVQKPWDNERLLAIVRTQVELGRALAAAGSSKPRTRRSGRTADSATHRRVAGDAAGARHDRARRTVDANVLITGENGTGKGLVAQALHAASPRAGRPMVTVNAGGLSEGVFESELFGHVKGAFTDAKTDRVGRFELADGGTLFLDEIANVP